MNWFIRINDVARTLMVVKYLDGVVFAADETSSVLKSHGTPCAVQLEAREEGYYAAHLYFKVPCTIPCENWDTEDATVSVEIQITTQVQEVIRRLLHAHYEERRLSLPERSPKWQWDYKSPEFAANYLGHVLHYIEGMIVDIREKQEQTKS